MTQGGQWELRVQFRRVLDTDPVEDASVAWLQDDNPYVPVAIITVPPQAGWSEDRATKMDDGAFFSPWHGIADHRTLSNIIRARKPAYAASSQLRGALNGCPMHEPVTEKLA